MNFAKSAIYLAITATTLNLNAYAEESVTSDSEGAEVITVVSDFREQNIQKVPTSLSVLSEADIQQRNAQHLEELIAVSPNVNFASGSQRARYYQIRGIGERSQFQEPINPSVGVIIDDVDFTGIGSIASLFDVKQAEIFRGPQGTRFGANAIAGMININTNDPTEDFEGEMQLTAGNYNTYDLGIALSGPATDAVNYRFAVNKLTSDGFIENTYLDKDDTNNREELTIRGKLAIQASPNLTIDLGGYYFDFNNGYDAFSLDNTRETLSDEPGFDTQETAAFSAKFTYEGFDSATVLAILSTANSDLGYGYDEDWAYAGISDPDVNPDINPDFAYWEYSSTDHYLRDKTVFTAELRALSKAGNEIFNGTTSWVTGIYFKNDSEDLLRQYTYLDSDFNSENSSQNVAAYGQFYSQLSERLSLTTGVRFENHSADYVNSDAFDEDISDTMFGGKLVLSFQQTDDTLWYGSINRGYKAGGHNTDGTLPAELRSFKPEYLLNYELGYKVSLLDNNAYVRSAIFYMDRDDMQVKSSKTILREDGSSEFISYLGNATSGNNYGAEIEAAWQVSNSINLYGSLGLLQTKFDEYIDSDGNSLTGEEQAHSPNYQFNAGINYQPTDHWLFNISIDGKDEFIFSDTRYYAYSEDDNGEDVFSPIPEADITSEPIVLVNASIAYIEDNWQLKVWGRNLANEDYANRGFYFPNDPRDGYTPKQYTQLSEPLVFGATLDYQF